MQIGYFLRTFPILSETFVCGEIKRISERTGTPFITAMYRPGKEVLTEPHKELADQTLYLLDIDKREFAIVIKANLAWLLKFPIKTMKAFRFGFKVGLNFRECLRTATLAYIIKNKKIDHFHTHFGWEQVDLLLFVHHLTSIPYSITMHAHDIYVAHLNLYERISGATFIITISDYNRRHLINKFNIAPEKVHVVHCGVDIDSFPYCPPVNNQIPTILSIGRIVEKKGFDVLIKALAILKTRGIAFQARIIGEGPLYTNIQKMIVELDLADCVTLPGSMPTTQIKDELIKCDIFALTCIQASNGDIDGIPVVLMEAMAIGRPVLSTRMSGIAELIQEDCGILVKQNDPQATAIGLERLLTCQSESQQYTQNSRKRIEKEFTLSGQVNGLLSIIKQHSSIPSPQ